MPNTAVLEAFGNELRESQHRSYGAHLCADVHDSDPGPCRGCSNFARCALKLIACDAFAAFVARDRHWSSAARIPLAETYRAVFA